jgi:hypothetical protein
VALALAPEVERCALIKSPGMPPAATNRYIVTAATCDDSPLGMSLNVSISFGHDTTHTNPSHIPILPVCEAGGDLRRLVVVVGIECIPVAPRSRQLAALEHPRLRRARSAR